MKQPVPGVRQLFSSSYRPYFLFDGKLFGAFSPKTITYRIYRDTRFSADKTPYKIHFGGYINAKGKKSDHCGCMYILNPLVLCLPEEACVCRLTSKAVRQSIYDNIEEFICDRRRSGV